MNPGDKEAEAKFKEATEAYGVLSDPDKRRQYDQFGHAAFENGVPVTDRPGHGIGVRSICAIVDRYGGMYSFLVEDNKFILRVSL